MICSCISCLNTPVHTFWTLQHGHLNTAVGRVLRPFFLNVCLILALKWFTTLFNCMRYNHNFSLEYSEKTSL
jgi:hypothetical protein